MKSEAEEKQAEESKEAKSKAEEKQVVETRVAEAAPVDIQEAPIKEDIEEFKEIVQVPTEESEPTMEEESKTKPDPNPLSLETSNQESKGETIVPSTSGQISTPPEPTMSNLPTEIKTETENKIERDEEPSAEAVSAITNSVISDMTNQSNVSINAVADEVDSAILEEPEEDDIIVTSTEGAIVSEKDETSSTSSSSNDSDDWDIVDEDERKEANTDMQVEPDHMLAPAMQNLGNTMFMSDMSRSAEELTVNQTDAATDAMTIPSVSSVPTISSGPNDAVAKRWENELEQLRELGLDDKTSVEALELLQAANLGVGSDERVTVTQVLEYLWK